MPLVSCSSSSTSEDVSIKESFLCPDGPCGNPGGGKDPPPPPPTWWYPAAGWNVLTASQVPVERGVQWWAYQWQGNTLAVKGYYPADFGTGIAVGSEPAHLFINFDVKSPTQWSADITLVYQTWFQGPLYPKAHVETTISEDGLISRYMRVPPPYTESGDIGSTQSDLNEGWYEDDGTGARLVWGADVSLRPASQAIMNFLTDFNNSGAVMWNLDTASSACDDTCMANTSSGLQNAILRRNTAAFADSTIPISCGAGGAMTVVCGAGLAWAAGLFTIAGGPPGLVAGILIAGVCSGAVYDDFHCGVEEIEQARKGPCVDSTIIIGPITGPDGRPYDDSHQMIDTYHCMY
ncbi:MAG TPA: hypothetical protein VLM79_02230 [Kofleriaceae bacterium]|nr:hypothetical protein [Kofleriaceae bacterium]